MNKEVLNPIIRKITILSELADKSRTSLLSPGKTIPLRQQLAITALRRRAQAMLASSSLDPGDVVDLDADVARMTAEVKKFVGPLSNARTNIEKRANAAANRMQVHANKAKKIAKNARSGRDVTRELRNVESALKRMEKEQSWIRRLI